MEIRNNENYTEDFSEEKNIPETKKGIWKVHKKTVDNFEKQINRAPYFQKHQIQAKCLLTIGFTIIGICFMFVYVFTELFKSLFKKKN